MSSVNVAPAPSQRGRPPGKAPLSTHSLNGSVTTGQQSSRPVPSATACRSSGVVRGVIRSTIVVTKETDAAIHSARPGSTISARSPTTRASDRAVAGQVVAGDEGERAGVGAAAGRATGDQPRGRGAHGRGEIAAQGLDVGADLGAVPVQAAVGAADVPGLGDRERHRRARPGRRGSRSHASWSVAGWARGQAADHLEAVAVGGAGDQRVEPVLCAQGVGQRARCGR